MNYLIPLTLIVLNYLMGSISSAILIARFVKKVDIRKQGFKTAGGSNVAEVIGVKWGVVVAAFDILKGIPILLISKLLNIDDIWLVLIGISAVIGHCWPAWFRFSGGRGLGTSIGIIFIITPNLAIYPIAIFIFSLIPSILRRKGIIDIKLISSPTITIVALFTYIYVTFRTEVEYDEVLSILIALLIFFRRVTARIKEYKIYDPIKLFFSRLIFDNSDIIK